MICAALAFFSAFLLLAVQLLVARQLFRLGLLRRLALGVVLVDLVLVLQALLFLFLLGGLLGLFLIDQPGFQQLVTQ